MNRFALLAVVTVFIAFMGILTDAGPLRPAPVHAHTCGPAAWMVDSSQVPKTMPYTISAGGETTSYNTDTSDFEVAEIFPQNFNGTDGIFSITAYGFSGIGNNQTVIRITWIAEGADESGVCKITVTITGAPPTPTPTPPPTPTPSPIPTTKPIVESGLTYSKWQIGIGLSAIVASIPLFFSGIGAPASGPVFAFGVDKTVLGYVAVGVTVLVDEFDPDVLPPERATRDGTSAVLGVNGPPAIGDIQNFLTGESIESAPPGTPILLVGSGFGLEFANQVTIDGQEVTSVGLSETELVTGVPIPLVANPSSVPFDDLPKDVEIVVTNGAGTSPPASFTVSLLAAPPGPPGSLIGPMLELEAELHEAMEAWDCTLIGNTKFVPEGRAQFIEECEEWLAGIPALLSKLEELLDLLPDLDPTSLLLLEHMLAPLAGIQDILEDELIPDLSDPDADGLPNGWDNCDTIANPDQLDADADLVGDACEFLLDLLFGDANCDGAINPVDSLTVLRYDAGLLMTPPEDCILHTADINCDEEVNPVDSLGLLRFDAGLPVTQADDCPLLGTTPIVATVDSGAGFSTLSRNFLALPLIAWLGLALVLPASVIAARRKY